MDKLTTPVFSGMAPAGNCACQLVTRGTEIVVDLACATHKNWRDTAITDAVRAEREACAEVAREHTPIANQPIQDQPADLEILAAMGGIAQTIAAAIKARTDAADIGIL